MQEQIGSYRQEEKKAKKKEEKHKRQQEMEMESMSQKIKKKASELWEKMKYEDKYTFQQSLLESQKLVQICGKKQKKDDKFWEEYLNLLLSHMKPIGQPTDEIDGCTTIKALMDLCSWE